MFIARKGNTFSLSLFLLGLVVLITMTGSPDTYAYGVSATLRIGTQEEFDGLGTTISDCLDNGEKNIVVEFSKGRYYYKHLNINITEKKYPDVSIHFKGNGSTLISAGEELTQGGPAVKYIKGAGFVDVSGNDFQNYTPMFQSDTLVEILDERSKRCRIHCPDLKGSGPVDCTDAYIRVTSWYTSFLYHVTKIENGYVYFKANNLAPGYSQYGGFNVNYDFSVGKILPRFRLINVPLAGCGIMSTPRGLVNSSAGSQIHQCEAGSLITIENCELKRLTIEGFNIIGNREDGRIFRFNGLVAESVVVKNCEVSAARGVVVSGVKTDNIRVENCVFHDNYQNVVHLNNTCANAVVTNNLFYNNGKNVENNVCIVCRGSNYLIAKNEIRDFNYGAIGVGVYYKSAKNSLPSFGVVEKNHIYYTSGYIADRANWTLVDGGAIYLWTKNDGAVIRNNFIHDYEGMGSNRGIYGDDGTCNCSIYGNIILNIGTGYSIDLRRSLTLDNQNIGLKSNVNNLYGNIFNNRFRFQGRAGDKSSVKGRNTILVAEGASSPHIVTDYLVEESKDETSLLDLKKWYKIGLRLVK